MNTKPGRLRLVVLAVAAVFFGALGLASRGGVQALRIPSSAPGTPGSLSSTPPSPALAAGGDSGSADDASRSPAAVAVPEDDHDHDHIDVQVHDHDHSVGSALGDSHEASGREAVGGEGPPRFAAKSEVSMKMNPFSTTPECYQYNHKECMVGRGRGTGKEKCTWCIFRGHKSRVYDEEKINEETSRLYKMFGVAAKEKPNCRFIPAERVAGCEEEVKQFEKDVKQWNKYKHRAKGKPTCAASKDKCIPETDLTEEEKKLLEGPSIAPAKPEDYQLPDGHEIDRTSLFYGP